jgi:hypothetical protein
LLIVQFSPAPYNVLPVRQGCWEGYLSFSPPLPVGRPHPLWLTPRSVHTRHQTFVSYCWVPSSPLSDRANV